MRGLRKCTGEPKKKKDQIMREMAFCGKRNRGWAACLKNMVNFLVAKIH
jgi:hypothetical protein